MYRGPENNTYITLSFWLLLDVAVYDDDDYKDNIDDEQQDEARVQEYHDPGCPGGVHFNIPEAVDLAVDKVHHVTKSLEFGEEISS